MMFVSTRFVGLALVASVVFVPAVAPAAEVDFARDVGPLLAKRCATCHDGAEKKGGLDLTTRAAALTGGDGGPVVVLGKPDDSPVWQRIVADEMPPKHPLSAAERDLVRRWIAAGAPWSGPALDPLAYTSEHRAGHDWWCLQPPADVAVPRASAWVRNPIDVFVEARLRQANLAPSPEADPRTLIRRLSFDLTGLPPTPDEVEAFVRACSAASALSVSAPSAEDKEQARTGVEEDAYAALVDRLLASPRYGERWARHWLDVARFGESQGFERDKLRSNSWRYRDWVIDAFNRDLPYDEFARLQIAGDVLEPRSAEGLVATGFLVAGPWDEVGMNQQSAAMKAVVRQDELEDLVSTVGQTFLGLTIHCARCHDHKFDPIRQSEYYALTAALAGARHGEPALPGSSLDERTAVIRTAIERRTKAVEAELEAIEEPRRRAILAVRKARQVKAAPPQPIAAWEFDRDGRDAVGGMHLELKDGAHLRGGMLVLGPRGYALSSPLTTTVGEKTLEAWVQVADLNQRGGGVLGLETLTGSKFDTIVFGERQPRRWMAGSNTFRRTQDVDGATDEDVAGRFVHVAITYDAAGKVALYRNGRPYGKPYQSTGLTIFDPQVSRVTFGLRHAPAAAGKLLHGAVDRARIYDRALSPDEIAATAGVGGDYVTDEELTAQLSPTEREARERLRFELEQLRQARERTDERKVYAVAAQKPEATFVLHRGNPAEPREPAPPGGIASLRGAAPFQLPVESTDAERRRRLAEWIASPANPLFARVMVNRLWHHHFGVGLVDTPNDFGFNGGRPSHPELLDRLAREFVRSGFRVKHVQRLIVTSAAYRQASTFRSEAAAVDANNRLLWRKSPQRLEAETLRDALLFAAGRLDETPHGPGFHEFTTFVRNSQFYEMRDAVGPTFERRTIYRTWGRSARSRLLDVFDCPDPSTKTPQRAVTTTPLQALSLMNDSFVLRMADALAERVRREVGDDGSAQTRRVFEHVFGRKPDADEAAAAERFTARHGLAALCRVTFNGNELLYVD